MKIASSAFEHNQKIPAKYTCDGEDVSPPLVFGGIPASAKSLVLIMDDPDAPRPPVGGWVHWTIWNISPETKDIPENSVPAGAAEGRTNFSEPGYGGPCPPFNPDLSVGAGTHRYFFKLYALDAVLQLKPESDKAALEKAMAGHILAQAELIGLYSR